MNSWNLNLKVVYGGWGEVYFYTLSYKVVNHIKEPYEGNFEVLFREGHYANPKY